MKTQYSKLTPKVKLTLIKDDKIYGKGVAELLYLTKRYSSINKACKEMGMSYTKAWTIIKNLEKALGYPVLESKIGGKNGGKTVITLEGKDLLDKYDKMLKDIEKYTLKVYKKYFK